MNGIEIVFIVVAIVTLIVGIAACNWKKNNKK